MGANPTDDHHSVSPHFRVAPKCNWESKCTKKGNNENTPQAPLTLRVREGPNCTRRPLWLEICACAFPGRSIPK